MVHMGRLDIEPGVSVCRIIKIKDCHPLIKNERKNGSISFLSPTSDKEGEELINPASLKGAGFYFKRHVDIT